MRTKLFGYILLFVVVVFGLYTLRSSEVFGGFLLNRTNTINVTSGLVGHWTFDGEDMTLNGSSAAWFDSNWQYRFKITSDNTKVLATNDDLYYDLSNAPAGFWTNVRSDGGDIRVTQADGTTEVAREVAAFDSGGNTGALYFKATGLSTSSDTDFYVYYGNGSATEPAADASNGSENVWVNADAGIWHFEGSLPTTTDSTSNSNDGTAESGVSTTTGQIDQALAFDKTNTDQYVTVPHHSSVDFGSNENFTISAWVKSTDPQTASNWPLFVSKEKDPGSGRIGYNMGLYESNDDSRWYAEIWDGSSAYMVHGSSAINDGSWHHVVFKREGSTIYTYEDGAFANSLSAVSSSISNTSADLHLGAWADLHSCCFFDGSLEEVRIYGRALSDNEVKTKYNNQSSPATFWTTGSQVDESSVTNTASDVSGSGNTGSLSGTTLSAGKIGQGLSFDGTNDYIDIGNVGTVQTISFWIKTDDTTSQKILDMNGTAQVELNASSQMTATSFPSPTIYVDTSSASSAINASTWHHVVITDTTGVSASALELGRVSASYFNGSLDDVRAYDRVLSQEEIRHLHLMGGSLKMNVTKTDIVLQGLVGYWSFDGGDVDGATTTDRSGFGNSGTFMRSAVTEVADQVTTYDTAGTHSYTAPSSATSLTVEVWASGGNGEAGNAGAGGGGGGWITGTYSNSEGETFTAEVRAGGSASRTGFYPDGGGGLEVDPGANGGDGGAGGSGSSSTGFTSVTTHAGGSGGSGYSAGPGDRRGGGGGGGSAGPDGVGSAGQAGAQDSGGSGGSGYVTGGDGGLNSVGQNGGAPGAGGGGGSNSNAGGTGGDGMVRITAHFPDELSGPAATSTVVATGKIGQGISFDKTSQDHTVISHDSSIDFGASQDFTIAVWVRSTDPQAANTWPALLSKETDSGGGRQGYNIGLFDADTDSRWFGEIYVGGTQHVVYGNSAINDGNWHQVVFMRQGSTLYTFENGELANQTSAVSSSISNTSADLHLGANADLPACCYFSGSLDDLRIYDRALSAEEVRRLYLAGSSLKLNTTQTGTGLSGMAAHWTFDGKNIDWSTNTASDRSGQNNNGAIVNMSTTTSPKIGKVGQALSFDGTDDYIAIASDASLNFGSGDFSYSLWVRTSEDCTGNKVWFGQRNQSASRPSVWLGCNDSGQANFQAIDSDDVGTTVSYTASTINNGNWHHVVAVKSGHGSGALQVYVDGQASSEAATTYTGNFDYSGTNPHSIAALEVSPFFYANAVIDDVRVYDRALTENEIQHLYRMGVK